MHFRDELRCPSIHHANDWGVGHCRESGATAPATLALLPTGSPVVAVTHPQATRFRLETRPLACTYVQKENPMRSPKKNLWQVFVDECRQCLVDYFMPFIAVGRYIRRRLRK